MASSDDRVDINIEIKLHIDEELLAKAITVEVIEEPHE